MCRLQYQSPTGVVLSHPPFPPHLVPDDKATMEGIVDKVTIASCADFVLTCDLQFKAKIRAAKMGGKFSTQFSVYNHIEVLVALQRLCGVVAIAKPTHLLLDIETSTLFAGDPEGLHDGEDIKFHVGSVCRLKYFTGHTTKQGAVNARLVVKCFDPDTETANKKGRKRKHASFANLGLNHYGVPLVGDSTLHISVKPGRRASGNHARRRAEMNAASLSSSLVIN